MSSRPEARREIREGRETAMEEETSFYSQSEGRYSRADVSLLECIPQSRVGNRKVMLAESSPWQTESGLVQRQGHVETSLWSWHTVKLVRVA